MKEFKFLKIVNGGKAIVIAKDFLDNRNSFMCYTILKGLGVPLECLLDIRNVEFITTFEDYNDHESGGLIEGEFIEVKLKK